MTSETEILRYQQRCFREYARAVGLPVPYTYIDGNPIRPLPPVQTVRGGLMIVGAYPSARFEARLSADSSPRRRLVPVADNLQPFAEEEYFDGVGLRRLESGYQIREHLLNHMHLNLTDCWVTDLVKVFLYKPDHLIGCQAVRPDFRPHVLRNDFAEFAEKSLPWLHEECDLCQPKLIVTLGEEVAQVVSGESTAKTDDLLTRPPAPAARLGGWPTLHLPHPDACRRFPKWRAIMGRRRELAATVLKEGTA
jgi:uracil-DNA glycosylase